MGKESTFVNKANGSAFCFPPTFLMFLLTDMMGSDGMLYGKQSCYWNELIIREKENDNMDDFVIRDGDQVCA